MIAKLLQLINKLVISFFLQKIEKIAYLRFIDTLFPNLHPKTHLHLNILEHCHFSGLLVETFHQMEIFLLLQTNKKHSVSLNLQTLLGKPFGNTIKDSKGKVVPYVTFQRQKSSEFSIPYARHYNPRFVYFLPHFSVRFIIKRG